jgi:hypothetical protein
VELGFVYWGELIQACHFAEGSYGFARTHGGASNKDRLFCALLDVRGSLSSTLWLSILSMAGIWGTADRDLRWRKLAGNASGVDPKRNADKRLIVLCDPPKIPHIRICWH